MRAYPDRNGKSFFGSQLFVVIGAAVCLLLLIAVSRTYYQNYRIKMEIADLKSEAEKLQGKRLQTLETLQYVESQAFVEEKARTELNLQKNGEQTAIISRTNSLNSEYSHRQENVSVVESETMSNIKKWWQYFFNHQVQNN